MSKLAGRPIKEKCDIIVIEICKCEIVSKGQSASMKLISREMRNVGGLLHRGVTRKSSALERVEDATLWPC
jgi:hypothetical protein